MTLESRPAVASRPGETGRLPLVVCVDDEPHILAALSRLLRGEPFELRTTADPDEALGWVRTEEVALFLADYRMPGLSGTTLLQLVKAASPKTGRILLTGYPGESIVVAARGIGLMDLVGKPWDDDGLKSMIRLRLENPSPVRPDEDA